MRITGWLSLVSPWGMDSVLPLFFLVHVVSKGFLIGLFYARQGICRIACTSGMYHYWSGLSIIGFL